MLNNIQWLSLTAYLKFDCWLSIRTWAGMPESPLSPTAARQTPASSLLSHTDNGAGERVANGDSCSRVSGESWQSLRNKQVSSSSSYSSTSPSSSFFRLSSSPPLHKREIEQSKANICQEKYCTSAPYWTSSDRTPNQEPVALLTVAGISYEIWSELGVDTQTSVCPSLLVCESEPGRNNCLET